MWSDGYVSEVEYTHGFYPEFSPNNLAFSCLAGHQNWRVPGEDFTYLELGFGQGLSLNINAAVTGGTYWGTDFNPGQAANAVDLAKVSGADVTAVDDSFEAFAARGDLPKFDAIVLHGIWSWVSNKNRYFITEIVRKHLKPGGVFYISYNAQPGWSGAGPLQNLLFQHAQAHGNGSMTSQVAAALKFAKTLSESGALYFRSQPAAVEKLKTIEKQDDRYVAHEFLNEAWHAIPFGRVAKDLSDAKLSFAAPARPIGLLEARKLPKEFRQILETIEDPVFRETVLDYIRNTQFRRDIFVKGARRLSDFEALSRWKEIPFVIRGNPAKRPESLTVSMGEILLSADLYDPIVEALNADDGAPKTLPEIQQFKSCRAITIGRLVEAVQLLHGAKFIAPVQSAKTVERARKSCSALNREICRRAEFSGDVTHLAAPLIGTGVPVGRIEQLYLRGESLKVANVPAWTWNIFNTQGLTIQEKGQPLRDDTEKLAMLEQQYLKFRQERRPTLQRLGVVFEDEDEK